VEEKKMEEIKEATE